MLTDEQMRDVLKNTNHMVRNSMHGPFWPELEGACRAIEAAATEPLLQRIAELEKALKLVQQHHATAWNRGHIAGMAANRMVAQDALNAVKKDAWNNTQLTEALMAAESRCEELERQLEDARKDAERYRWLRETRFIWGDFRYISGVRPTVVGLEFEWFQTDAAKPTRADLDAAIDAAMQKGQS